MSADDAKDSLDSAIEKNGADTVEIHHRPRLMPESHTCYVANDLQAYLAERDIALTLGKPYHPMTQDKIERYYRNLKNIIKCQNYYLPWKLEKEIA